jgi:hypothetical protein
MSKFQRGQAARQQWSKPITVENTLSIEEFNSICGDCFYKRADIVLDSSEKRQSTLLAQPTDPRSWKEKKEHIYLLVRKDAGKGKIMKIGGTRTSLDGRWGSYLCGYYVPERVNKKGVAYPGKMSVTNAHLYHTIENDLLSNETKWELYSWELPTITVKVDILGESIEVIAQTFHAYESMCIKTFQKRTGKIPLLCENSDPGYRV